MLGFYRLLTEKAEPLMERLLESRVKKGKEDIARLDERMGISDKERPTGPLIWLHAASVGESQSALSLINTLLQLNTGLHILVTTGTKTSAALMAQKLPKQAFHQYYPLDHPEWAQRFIDHWQPDFVLWMESEIWPNMLSAIKKKDIPAILINAKLSDASYGKWRLAGGLARKTLSTFSLILTQTERDAKRFSSLCDVKSVHTDNLKYSAKALSIHEEDFKNLAAQIGTRPLWLYASTHAGEEKIACRVHQILKSRFPELLTIIVPRHPERGEEIKDLCDGFRLDSVLRGEDKNLPEFDTDIYIANTLGELGLFYRLAPVACIGRSLSDDGGGGHNPIEAAQLNCAVLHGPNVQYQKDIYDEMNSVRAASRVNDEHNLADKLTELLENKDLLQSYQSRGLEYAKSKEQVIDRVMNELLPLLEKSGLVAIQRMASTG